MFLKEIIMKTKILLATLALACITIQTSLAVGVNPDNGTCIKGTEMEDLVGDPSKISSYYSNPDKIIVPKDYVDIGTDPIYVTSYFQVIGTFENTLEYKAVKDRGMKIKVYPTPYDPNGLSYWAPPQYWAYCPNSNRILMMRGAFFEEGKEPILGTNQGTRGSGIQVFYMPVNYEPYKQQ
ncbi:MAG: hypothetical protein K0R14_338 [Burkholderiales bacterium]|jgi:hypothetical protein|nr:hypothetical protein [Burkholderiales bacterium]